MMLAHPVLILMLSSKRCLTLVNRSTAIWCGRGLFGGSFGFWSWNLLHQANCCFASLRISLVQRLLRETWLGQWLFDTLKTEAAETWLKPDLGNWRKTVRKTGSQAV